MRFLHLPREDCLGKVSTVAIYDNGYASFKSDDEYSIQDLKDVIAEAEFNLDNPQWDEVDYGDDDLDSEIDDSWDAIADELRRD